MEARLFFLSIWCGVYAVMVRQARKYPAAIENRGTIAVLNGLFWATFAVMAGMLMASYTEKMDLSFQYAAIFGAAGALIGCVTGFWRGGSADTRDALIDDNLEWADTGFSAILLASVVMFFFVQAFKIPSGSMRMTLVEGDHLFVNKFVYGFPVPFTEKKVAPMEKPTVGDIVIFRFPAPSKDDRNYGKDFIKRCIAVEGQEVKIVNKQVYVDGVPRNEPFKRHVDTYIYPALRMAPDRYQEAWETGEFAKFADNSIRDNFGPVKVPPGHIFVMGDNRDSSFDSRFWGPLDVKEIKGKAWLLYYPFNRIRVIK